MTMPANLQKVLVEQEGVAADEPADPYVYGWREMPRITPEGELRWERLPLTLADILHPQVGDFRVHTDDHQRACVYLYDVLRAWLAKDPHAVVLHDTRVSWGVDGPEPHGPDIAVIFNVRERRNWATFDTAAEGAKPALIIEVTSPKTRSVDLADKVVEYAQAGVPYYAIVDSYQFQGRMVWRLVGYRLVDEGYEIIAPDEHGRLWLEPVRLWLGLWGSGVALYDEQGHRQEDYVTVFTRAEIAELR
ncbi:MAG: Uma2 family endonuclease, partial [Chloroflexota bacterium]